MRNIAKPGIVMENVRQAFMDSLLTAAKNEEDIIALTSDATGSAALSKYVSELPEQFVECGIAEQDMVGIAAGLASFGKRPFVCGPASFLSARALEQVKVDVAYSDKNVKLIGVSGGISYGALGESHYSVQDFAVMRAIANISVICPADAIQASKLAGILASLNGPVYLRMGRGAVPSFYDETDVFEIGRAYECRQGSDVTIIATGEQVYPSLVAAEKLHQTGIEARVMDMFTIKPIDREAVLRAAQETKAIVTVEEHSINGGLGSAVAQITAEASPVRVKCLGLPNEVLLCGSAEEMKIHYGLDADGIQKAVLEVMNKYE